MHVSTVKDEGDLILFIPSSLRSWTHNCDGRWLGNALAVLRTAKALAKLETLKLRIASLCFELRNLLQLEGEMEIVVGCEKRGIALFRVF